MLRHAQNLLKSERGATAIEYGLIAALVSVGAIIALDSMGDSLSSIFSVVSSELTQIASTAQGS
jgi:pilus assembly protein Flp/PilA